MFQRFVASIHQSEWLTIYILAIQALIFIWQSFILRHHGNVMDKQSEISKKQADIAADQAKIVAAQFDFEMTGENFVPTTSFCCRFWPTAGAREMQTQMHLRSSHRLSQIRRNG